jgi:hypothetical protein
LEKATKVETQLKDDPLVKKQVSLTQDLKTIHHENPTFYPKIINPVTSLFKDKHIAEQATRIEWKNEQEPSEQPLPILW